MTIKTSPTLKLEQAFWNEGLSLIAGLDEAGRGAWAGPVAAGAVILPREEEISEKLKGVRDSKRLSPRQRERLFPVIQTHVLSWGVGFASNIEVDAYGIVPATKLAMERALSQLIPPPQALVIDALQLKTVVLPQQSVNFGDSISLSIAAASILAKVSRDHWMIAAENRYPGYGFARHKGYGTRKHRMALEAYGTCEVHRFSYKPIKAQLSSC
ncbi:MAG: ribonuclease HII [Anaerolineaceae bacterium]|nr:ribonuclease HII [Anaerolineaceae bacterium]